MAHQAVKIFLVGIITLAVIQGIAGINCWSGAKVGDAAPVMGQLDCSGQTNCLTYDLNLLGVKTTTWACGNDCSVFVNNCVACGTDLCNNARTISANSLTLVVIFSVYKMLQGWISS